MTHPIYTSEHLATLKRPQLWSICDQLGLPKHASNAKCVEAILNAQPIKVADVEKGVNNEADNIQETAQEPAAAQSQQPLICANCPKYKAHNDGTSNGWCRLFDHFTKEYHPLTSDCVNTLADARYAVDNGGNKTNITPGAKAERLETVNSEQLPVTSEEKADNCLLITDNCFVAQPPYSTTDELATKNYDGDIERTLNLNTALTPQQGQFFSISDYEAIKLEDVFTDDRIIVQGIELEVLYSRPAFKEGDVEVIVNQLDGKTYGITHRADMVVEKWVPPPNATYH